MNKFEGIGRLTKDPELRKTPNDVSVCTFTVAIDRRFNNSDGNKETDFLPCVAWRGTADFIGKYFAKGKKIAIAGSVQTRNYQAQDGSKRFVTEIVVDEAEFVESKNDGQTAAAPAPVAEEPTPYETDDLPF